MKCCLDLAF